MTTRSGVIHNCRVNLHIATRIDARNISPSRALQILTHLQEVYPCTAPKEVV